MENASKALVIAGAILISILLITIGVFIINSITGTTDELEGKMNNTAAETFNSGYTAYIGTQNGSNVKSLLNKVVSNNSITNAPHKIMISFKGAAASDTVEDISGYVSSISTIKTYTVTIPGYSNGYVSQINIVEN